jgi:N-acetylmuramoyl-L-alanine amidase
MARHRIHASILLLSLVVCFAWPSAAEALTAREKYFKAEACYRDLQKNPRDQKYRDNWLQCIEKFQDVYRHDPSGPWAAAGLYMTGTLYKNLYQLSYKSDDRREALDSFQRLVNRYPTSRYKSKAMAGIEALKGEAAAASPPSPDTPSIRSKYAEAEACYRDLARSPSKRRYRDNWLICIDKFQEVHLSDPSGPWAAAGLYRTAGMYEELYAYSKRAADLQTARSLYQQIVDEYTQSIYHPKALAALKKIPSIPNAPVPAPTVGAQKSSAKEDGIATILEDSSEAPEIEQQDEAPKAGALAIVNGLRFWSNPNYTRVVIDADQEADFNHRLLKKDPEIQKPQRLYIDLKNSRLKPDIERKVPINDDLLTNVRAGQYRHNAVRVVVDIKSFKTYKVFSLRNPFRIVIDVWGHAAPDQQSVAGGSTPSPKPNGSLAKQLALGVSRIVVDPGHGGKDYGAPGYYKGVHEKNVTLAIGKRLARKIHAELKYDVVMTRDQDLYLSLEERTAIANTKNADLFISIHTNAVTDRRAYGIETFFLNLATDDDAILVAARENATSTKNISDLQTILNDLMQNAKINESSRLAAQIQVALYTTLKSKYGQIKSKGVKQAPFYVLLGAQMPSILIETSFISNPRECKRLMDPQYQDLLCDGIIKGIQNYVRETNPSAFMTSER